MALKGDALKQAFMPKREYSIFEEEDTSWMNLQRTFLIVVVSAILLTIVISTLVSLKIVFPGETGRRPFCSGRRFQLLSIDSNGSGGDSDLFPGAFYLTDQETVDYYWMVVFLPSLVIFFAFAAYLVAGMFVAYYAPERHGCVKMVENNYCASKRGGVRCLSILNVIFAIVFGLLALFLGSTLLTLGSSCSAPLFWCYEIATWGVVILYAGTASLLRRKAAAVHDESDFNGRNLGLEMLEANTFKVTPEVERRVDDG